MDLSIQYLTFVSLNWSSRGYFLFLILLQRVTRHWLTHQTLILNLPSRLGALRNSVGLVLWYVKVRISYFVFLFIR